MFNRQFMTLTFGAVLMSAAAFAQEDYTAYESDASVQGLGSFVKQTTQDGIKQDATNSGGVVGTYRFWFSRHNGVEANYAWTSNTEKYNTFGVDNNSPTYDLASLKGLDRVTHRAEPSIGFGWRF